MGLVARRSADFVVETSEPKRSLKGLGPNVDPPEAEGGTSHATKRRNSCRDECMAQSMCHLSSTGWRRN